MYLASGVARVPEMRQQGITIALATDGPGSNNYQDMLEVLKTTCLLHKVSTLNAMVLLPEDALWMACRGGAAAFGQPELIGSLEVGKKADMVLVDLNTPLAMPVQPGFGDGLQRPPGTWIRCSLTDTPDARQKGAVCG